MALARLALKKLQPSKYSFTSSSLLSNSSKQGWGSQLMDRLVTTSSAADNKGESTTVPVVSDKADKKPKPSSRKRHLWRNKNHGYVPALWEFFPSGLGNALMQATENVNRVLENLRGPQLLGRFKEKEECYKLKYEMPGMAKDDVKITVEDGGVLRIKGEHKEEENEDEDEGQQYWSSKYGYYDTRLMLPEDAKVDEIKAEMKDGVLKIKIPRSEKQQKDVKEVRVQ